MYIVSTSYWLKMSFYWMLEGKRHSLQGNAQKTVLRSSSRWVLNMKPIDAWTVVLSEFNKILCIRNFCMEVVTIKLD